MDQPNNQSCLLLCCGYRRTGKDILFRQLSLNDDSKYQYTVFKAPNNPNNFKMFCNNTKLKRIGFADELKRDVNEIFCNTSDPFAFEHRKDDLYVRSDNVLWGNDLRTIREYYIIHGRNQRLIDPDYWVKQVALKLDDNPHMITDFRFPNEYKYFASIDKYNVSTVRVFRSTIPIPDQNEASEHSLDTFKTDYVILSGDNINDEFKALIKLFPQYTNFEMCMKF